MRRNPTAFPWSILLLAGTTLAQGDPATADAKALWQQVQCDSASGVEHRIDVRRVVVGVDVSAGAEEGTTTMGCDRAGWTTCGTETGRNAGTGMVWVPSSTGE